MHKKDASRCGTHGNWHAAGPPFRFMRWKAGRLMKRRMRHIRRNIGPMPAAPEAPTCKSPWTAPIAASQSILSAAVYNLVITSTGQESDKWDNILVDDPWRIICTRPLTPAQWKPAAKRLRIRLRNRAIASAIAEIGLSPFSIRFSGGFSAFIRFVHAAQHIIKLLFHAFPHAIGSNGKALRAGSHQARSAYVFRGSKRFLSFTKTLRCRLHPE